MIWFDSITVGLLLAAVAEHLTASRASSQVETVPVRVRAGRRELM